MTSLSRETGFPDIFWLATKSLEDTATCQLQAHAAESSRTCRRPWPVRCMASSLERGTHVKADDEGRSRAQADGEVDRPTLGSGHDPSGQQAARWPTGCQGQACSSSSVSKKTVKIGSGWRRLTAVQPWPW